MADIPRIKGNIQKMIGQGAPEADIDAYLAGEGVTIADLKGISKTEDVARSSGEGLKQGTIALGSMGGDARQLVLKGAEYLGGKALGEERAAEVMKPVRSAADTVGRYLPAYMLGGNTSAENKKTAEQFLGPEYQPQTTEGRYAKGVAEFLPGAVLPGGTVPMRIASAMLGGAGSVAGGDIAQAKFGEGAKGYGELAGGVAGGFSPNILARAVTPIGVSPSRQRLLDILGDEGVTSLTAGQRTGNKRLQYLEDAAGNAPMAGGRPEAIRREGQEQFTEAVNRRAGIAGREATPEVLAANQDRLGTSFRDLAARNDMTPDNQFIGDIVDAVRNYRRVPDSQQRAMVQGYVDDIIDHVNAGAMPGREYQEMRSRLSRQANGLRQSDPTLSEALRDMRNALDNAMDRSISGADRDLWRQNRREYGAQKDIEKAVSRAGPDSAEGQIVPANIRNVVSTNNRGAYARGEGDLSELSRAGSGIMAPLPNSGTAQRSNAFDLLNGITMGAIPAATGRVLMSGPAQAWLGNAAINLDRLPPARRAVLQALIARGEPALQLRGPVEQPHQ